MRNYEKYNRKRNIYIGFRLSPEEKQRLDKFVKLSGMTERDYVAKRSLQEEIVVVGNTKVFKALKEEFTELISELKRIKNSNELSGETMKIINFALKIYAEMKENVQNEKSK